MTTWLNHFSLEVAAPLRAVLPLLALSGGCNGKDGLLTSHEESESSTADGQTDTVGPVTDSGACETACTPEAVDFACVRELTWNDGLIGMAHRDVFTGCPSCEYWQVVLLEIDPVTAQQTLLGEGPVNSIGDQMAVASDGSIFVAGSVEDKESFSSSALLLKFSPAGELLWQITPDEEPFVGGVLREQEVVVGARDHDLIAFSATDGARLWDVPSHDGEPHRLALDAQGAIYVAGAETYPEDDALPSWYVRKYAADRTLLWDHVAVMTEDDRPYVDGLAFDEAGGVVIGVRSGPFAMQAPASASIHKLTVDGAEVWSRPLPVIVPNVDTDDFISDVLSRPGGGVIVTGGTQADDVGFTIALDPDGEVLWQDLQQGEGLQYLTSLSATVADGQLLVSGCEKFGKGSGGWLRSFMP